MALPERIAELAASLPPLAPNAVTVLEKRYLDKDDTGRIRETPDELYNRVATTLAQVEKQYGGGSQLAEAHERFFRLMRASDFLPNSPTLANAGTRTGQLSACFVLPISDSLSNGLDGIYDTLKDAQLIFQTGGGVGYAFSRLRRKGAIVKTTRGVSSGPMSFMDVYNTSCGSIAQGGIRRGAQMGILRVDHPDILEFIAYKSDLTRLTNFNVSVAITDAFLQALEIDGDYELIDPTDGPTGTYLNSRTVFKEIVQRAWATGEPGMVFIDRANAAHPTPRLGAYEATNPCGEQWLSPYESCNLGSINLRNFVTGKSIDWARLRQAIHDATWLMDNVVDANHYVQTVPKIRDVTLQTRKLGLGIMGLAGMLAQLDLPYDSPEGRTMASKVYAFIDVESKMASIELAKTKGPFPYFVTHQAECLAFYQAYWSKRQLQAYQDGFTEIGDRYGEAVKLLAQHGLRNSTTTTVAPTGTLSILANTDGGCEPFFALVISRFQADTEMLETNQLFEQRLRSLQFTEQQIQTILEGVANRQQGNGSLKRLLATWIADDTHCPVTDLRGLAEVAATFVTAGDIQPDDHVLMQAAIQAYNDSSCSKTINFPEEATPEDVERAYELAIQTGCKGITVYRDGSRSNQPLTAGNKTKKEGDTPFVVPDTVPTLREPQPRPRPRVLVGQTYMQPTGDGKLYATFNYDTQGLREVFAIVGRSGGTTFSLTEAISRLISLALQYGVPRTEIAHKLTGIRSSSTYGFGSDQVVSIPDAIGQLMLRVPEHLNSPALTGTETLASVLLLRVPDNEPVHAVSDAFQKARTRAIEMGENPECSECGWPMKFGEGCKGGTCTNPACGHAKC